MALALILVLLSSVTLLDSAGVAPGDEDPLCEQYRAEGVAPTPALSYSDNMRVLMDSWNYQNLLPPRTGAVWDQVDNDMNNSGQITTEWIQNSNFPCGGIVNVCGFTAGPQDNWLITQLINRTVNGTRLPQVKVLMEFEMHDCSSSIYCQQFFTTHVYETSSVSTTGARNLSNYRQVQRVSPSVLNVSRVSETISIVFNANHSSFYFAIQDGTTCIAVTRVIVFYLTCPSQTANLILYPESTFPSTTIRLSGEPPVNASCVQKAEPENKAAPKVICLESGIWSFIEGAGCRCIPGYFSEDHLCKPCPVGTYLSPSNNSTTCSTCPANSVSEQEGSTQCTCVEGYYRATQEEEDLACIPPPSPPQNIRIVNKTEDFIILAWDLPMYQGTGILTYGVYFITKTGARIKTCTTNERTAVIANLCSRQSYIVYISSENAITDQVPEDQFTSIATSIEVTTVGPQAIGIQQYNLGISLAATIPSLFTLTLMLSFIVLSSVVLYRCYKTHKKVVSPNDNPQGTYEEVSCSTVDSDAKVEPKTIEMEENSAYGKRNLYVYDVIPTQGEA